MTPASSRTARIGASILLSAVIAAGLAPSVLAASATHLVVLLPGQSIGTGATCLTGSATPTATQAGSAVTVTVEAVDGSCIVDSTATPTVAITSSDPNATLPANAALASGIGSFLITFKTAGSRTVNATDVSASLTPGTSAAIAVNPGPESKLQVLLPGQVAAPGTALGYIGSPTPLALSAPFGATVSAVDQYWNVITTATGSAALGSATDPAFSTSPPAAYSGGVASFTASFGSAGNEAATATDTNGKSGVSAVVSVGASASSLYVSAPASAAAGSAFSVTVSAVTYSGGVMTGYKGTVHFTSTDPSTTLPADYTFTTGDAGIHTFSVTLNDPGTWSVTATDSAHSNVTGSASVVVTAADTFHALTPARLLDTRTGNGISGPLSANSPATFTVWGRGGVPSNATAVTGNLTVVDSTGGWAVFLGPNATSTPTSSTINFTAGQVVANGVTVALSSSGTLSATYISTVGNTTDLVFDVTGYYTPDNSGAYYFPINPVRLLDTRSGLGLSARLSANTPATFQVTGYGYVPANATAVTGNLTVTGATSGWAVFLGPDPTASPTSSTINFSQGSVVANNVTVALNSLGKLSATFISTAGNTTDLVFDVTGYFVPGLTSGARYVPLTPARALDTRYGTGLSGAQPANVPATFTVWGNGGVSNIALAITGNLTVTDQTSGWAVFLGPNATYSPTSSTINFAAGQVVANGVTVGLSATGTLSATYISIAGQTTDLVLDVSGYFVH